MKQWHSGAPRAPGRLRWVGYKLNTLPSEERSAEPAPHPTAPATTSTHAKNKEKTHTPQRTSMPAMADSSGISSAGDISTTCLETRASPIVHSIALRLLLLLLLLLLLVLVLVLLPPSPQLRTPRTTPSCTPYGLCCRAPLSISRPPISISRLSRPPVQHCSISNCLHTTAPRVCGPGWGRVAARWSRLSRFFSASRQDREPSPAA